MRIGLVIYGSLETVSGGYLYDRKLVEFLRRAGDRVEIISRPWRNYAHHLADNASTGFFRQLRDAPIDLLLQDELNHPSLFLINRRLRRQATYPILSIVHHPRCYESHPAALNRLYRRIERKYLSSVDGCIVNSETTRQAVRQILDRSESLPTIVAYPAGDRFRSRITPEQIIARTNQADVLRVVFVGNLIPRKGLHTLIDAVAMLPRHVCKLTVVGDHAVDEKYAQSIRRRIAQHHLTNVRLTSALPDDALAHILAHSHVLAVPSDYEGFGIVYLEGMSFGLPAIATTAGAAREVIMEGVNGYLVEPNDPTMLAARLRELQAECASLTRMSLAARERFLAHPTWEDSAGKIRHYLIGWIT